MADARRGYVVALAVGLGCLVSSLALTDRGLLSSQGAGDTGLYGQYGQRVLDGRLPYRDFFVEFPPGSLAALVAPAAGPPARYVTQFKAFETIAAALALAASLAALVAAAASRRRLVLTAAAIGVAPGVLGPIAINAFDYWPALFLAVGLAAAAHGRASLAGGLVGVGAATKLFPAVALPFLLLRGRPHRTVAAFAAAGLAVVLPFLLLAPGGVRFSLESQLTRGLQVESLGASLLVALDKLGLGDLKVVVGKPHSLDLEGAGVGIAALAGSLLPVLAIVYAILLIRRRAQTVPLLLTAVAAATCSLVAFGKVLSPQFLVWLIPLVPLVGRPVAPTLVLGAALALTHVWFPSRFDEVVALGGVSWVVLIRNLLLVALAILLFLRLREAADEQRE